MSLKRLPTAAPTIVLLLIAAVMAFFQLQATFERIGHSRAVGPIEPQVIEGCLRLARGETLYQDYSHTRPVVVLTYGLLEYVVPGMIARLISPAAELVVMIGRLVSALSGLGAVTMLALLARQRGIPGLLCAAAAAPLLLMPRPFEWAAKLAPDVPALFFSLCGWWLLRSNGNTTWMRIRTPLAVAVWTIGFHFKPNVIPGQIGFLFESGGQAWKLYRADRRAAMRFALRRLCIPACYTILSLGTAAIIIWSTSGMYAKHILLPEHVCIMRPFFAARAVFLLLIHPNSYYALLFLYIICTLAHVGWPLRLAFTASLVLDLGMASKQGSHCNYLLSSLSVSGVLFAQASLDSFTQTPSTVTSRLRTWASATACVAFSIIMWPHVKPGNPETGAVIIIRDEFAQELAHIKTSYPSDRLLALDAFVGQYSGWPFVYTDGFTTELMRSHGVVEFQDIADKITRRHYAYIATDKNAAGSRQYHDVYLTPKSLLIPLLNNYKVERQLLYLTLWVPKAPSQ